MKVPKKIQVGSRVFAVDRKPRKEGSKLIKAAKNEVWLTPEGGTPYRSTWPLRLHGETAYKVLVA